jgi:hypothetical protein
MIHKKSLLSQEELDKMRFYIGLDTMIDDFLKENDKIVIKKRDRTDSFFLSCGDELFMIDLGVHKYIAHHQCSNVYQSQTPVLELALKEALLYFKNRDIQTKSLNSIKFILED